MKAFFIAGTDTDVGKTQVAVSLLAQGNKQNLTTLGCKPVATGCTVIAGKTYNDDALALQQHSSIKLPYATINPYSFTAAAAAHIAAQLDKSVILLDDLVNSCNNILNYGADIVIIESVGGWYVPINKEHTMADLAIALQIPVILVVGIKLGCINHSLMTMELIKSSGLSIAGWVANQIDENVTYSKEIIETITMLSAVPCITAIPYIADLDHIALYFDSLDIFN